LLNLILLSIAQIDILSLSMLAMFSASPTDSVFIIIKERRWESVDWIDLDQPKGTLWAIVNALIYNFQKMRGNSLLA